MLLKRNFQIREVESSGSEAMARDGFHRRLWESIQCIHGRLQEMLPLKIQGILPSQNFSHTLVGRSNRASISDLEGVCFGVNCIHAFGLGRGLLSIDELQIIMSS